MAGTCETLKVTEEYLGTNRLSAEKRKRFEDDGQKHGDKAGTRDMSS